MTHPDLPPEMRLAAFKHVDSFAACHKLLRTNAAANSTFNQYPAEVIELVVHQLPKELQQIIHAIAVGQCSSSVDIPLVPDELLFNRETSYNTSTAPEDALPPISFDLGLRALRDLLDLGHRIQLLASIFSKTHIRRLNALRPQHLAKSGFIFSSYPFKKYPEGRTYTPTPTGPASWVEAYRIERALWRLQFYSLFTVQGTRVTMHTDDEASAIECSIPYRQHEFSKMLSLWTRWETDEILCVQDYLEEARISLRAPASTSADPTRASTSTLAAAAQLGSAAGGGDKAAAESAAQKFQDLIAVKRSTEAYNFFHRYGLRAPTSPLQRSLWDNFRRLGFGMWDQERMCTMELFRMPAALREKHNGKDMSIDDVAFTWRSVEEQGVTEHADLSAQVASMSVSVTQSQQHLLHAPQQATYESSSTTSFGQFSGSTAGSNSSGAEEYDSSVNGFPSSATSTQTSQSVQSNIHPPQHRAVLSLTTSNASGRTSTKGVASSPVDGIASPASSTHPHDEYYKSPAGSSAPAGFPATDTAQQQSQRAEHHGTHSIHGAHGHYHHLNDSSHLPPTSAPGNKKGSRKSHYPGLPHSSSPLPSNITPDLTSPPASPAPSSTSSSTSQMLSAHLTKASTMSHALKKSLLRGGGNKVKKPKSSAAGGAGVAGQAVGEGEGEVIYGISQSGSATSLALDGDVNGLKGMSEGRVSTSSSLVDDARANANGVNGGVSSTTVNGASGVGVNGVGVPASLAAAASAKANSHSSVSGQGGRRKGLGGRMLRGSHAHAHAHVHTHGHAHAHAATAGNGVGGGVEGMRGPTAGIATVR